ncbi:hypothetical protein LO763_10820 [Glycomyces sp. A-F 0318]|uniref:hypothetical protein n=1 Tax=Glycomyces amatae TaxID=2881355 RepID=UPI001E3C2DD3|nr:hypothetical protein [Glycomyces amatae]MCD0444116.1 hypothetical protein [Glycomyces amatae]
MASDDRPDEDSGDVQFHNRFDGPVDAVVQAGTFNGRIDFHFQAERAPLDLYALRLWIDRIARDHRLRLDRGGGGPEGPGRLADVEAVLGGINDSPKARTRQDMVPRLIIGGVVAYLGRAGHAPRTPLPEQVLLDLIVFGMWPIVTARKLPEHWQGQLSMLTSPRLAALVARAREAHRSDGEAAAEDFARRVADRDFAPAMINLFDYLGDPRRGGALLASMAVVGGLEQPSGRGARKVLTWVVGIAGGAAVVEAVLDPDSRLRGLIEAAIADLPVDPFVLDLSELFADIMEGLEG